MISMFHWINLLNIPNFRSDAIDGKNRGFSVMMDTSVTLFRDESIE